MYFFYVQVEQDSVGLMFHIIIYAICKVYIIYTYFL